MFHIIEQVYKKHFESVNYENIKFTISYIDELLKQKLTENKITVGPVIFTKPTQADCERYVKQYINDQKDYWDRNGYFHVKDTGYGNKKRYVGRDLTKEEYINKKIEGVSGIICELFVISFLNNSTFVCPICRQGHRLHLCNTSGVPFCDAICMGCNSKGIKTVYEIKTRNERTMTDRNDTPAGDWVSIEAYHRKNINVILIVVSRDTGTIRVGRITRWKIIGKPRFMYGLQEHTKLSSPASHVFCEDGFTKLDISLILNNYVTPELCNNVVANLRS